MLFLTIVLLSGTEAHINPREIISILEARDASDPMKRYAPEVRCVVITTDGKEYTTGEECKAIEERLHALFEERMRSIKGPK